MNDQKRTISAAHAQRSGGTARSGSNCVHIPHLRASCDFGDAVSDFVRRTRARRTLRKRGRITARDTARATAHFPAFSFYTIVQTYHPRAPCYFWDAMSDPADCKLPAVNVGGRGQSVRAIQIRSLSRARSSASILANKALGKERALFGSFRCCGFQQASAA